MTKRVLVTGVGGFVGSHLVSRIVQRGGTALGLGINPPVPELARSLAGMWPVDICDQDGLRAALAEAAPSAVIHLAAQSSGMQSFEQPVETHRVNVLGTLTLLEAVRASVPKARVVVVGTGEVYGRLTPGTRATEETPIRPVSPYALSKALADAIAEYHGRNGLDVIRTRSFGHVGPGQRDSFVLPSFARQIAEIEAGLHEPVLCVGNLDLIRDFTDVRDVVDAYLALLECGRPGAVYNVCRGVGVLLADVTRSLCERARIPIRITVDPGRVREVDIPYMVGDPTAIADASDWAPGIPLEQTLDDILNDWRNRVAVEARARV